MNGRTSSGATGSGDPRQAFHVDEAFATIRDFRGEIRSLKVVVLVGGVLLAAAVIAMFGVLAAIRSGQHDARDRGYRNRTVACVQTVALIGSEHLPDDCVELTKVVDPNTGRPYLVVGDALLCGLLRDSPDTAAYLEQFEADTGERCEDPPGQR